MGGDATHSRDLLPLTLAKRPVCFLALRAAACCVQAAHLTNGVYEKPSSGVMGILQYFLVGASSLACPSSQYVLFACQMLYLPDSRTRKHLLLPQTTTVDFRATCFCHKNITEIGYVCPVCLSSEHRPALLSACSLVVLSWLLPVLQSFARR